MKTNNYISTGLIAATLILFSSRVFALGIGVTAGAGTEEWDGTSESTYDNSYNDNGGRGIGNFGFVLDTAVARNSIFNYRLSLMAEDNNNNEGGEGLNMSGSSMTHDFGFAVVRNRNMRIWIGPRLRIATYTEFEEERSPYGVDEDSYNSVTAFSFGPVIGFNIHLPKLVTFSITAAYLGGIYNGSYEVLTGFGLSEYEDVDVESTGTYINASIIFRIGDDYRKY